MEKKLDLRVQKTRSALTNALYDLMCQKSLDEITVTELCEKAMVRKATFYKHFGDKTELLVYMIQEMQRLSEETNIIGYDPAVPSSYYTGVFRCSSSPTTWRCSGAATSTSPGISRRA